MSNYQVLARKYRPKNFAELLGQTHVSTALANAIDGSRLHHAYLFTGTRGVGKTTIARILAKCLNCETGITSQPCGVCDACVSVDEGRFLDLIEIDAASRTKVEDTRDLLENVPYAPVQGRYKVYLIDEVHMLSTHSFNALLKTLEEPPEHVKFILATTDPQKLPITILSRCLQFVLRPLSQELLHEHLSHILRQEQISFDDGAVWQLAQSAKGSVRDALSLTDQAIAFGGGFLGSETVLAMLGLVDTVDVLALIGDIVADNRSRVATHIERMRMQMVDAVAILDKLVDSFHQLALMQILPDVPLDMNDTQKRAFTELSQRIAADVLQLYYEISAKSRDSVRLASTPMQALEMGILRLLAFRPLGVTEAPIVAKLPAPEVPSPETSLTPEAVSAPIALPVAESAAVVSEGAKVPDDTSQVKTDDDHKAAPDGLKSAYAFDHADLSITNTVAFVADSSPQAPTEQKDTPIAKERSTPMTAQSGDEHYADMPMGGVVESICHDMAVDSAFAADMLPEMNLTDMLPDMPVPIDVPSSNQISAKQSNSEQSDGGQPHLAAPAIQQADTPYVSQAISNGLSTPLVATVAELKPTHDELTLLDGMPSHALHQAFFAPVAELTGAWDAGKWDYWTHQAYQNGQLSADEFALAANGLIAGEIVGESTLSVVAINYQVEVSFQQLAKKIKDMLGSVLKLNENAQLLLAETPQQRHQLRYQAAIYQGQLNLSSSPVMQTLQSAGFLAAADSFSALIGMKQVAS